jgi:cytochrome P450
MIKNSFLSENLTKNFDSTDGHVIPKEANVFITSFCMSRHEDFWEEPLKFKPERFDVDAPQRHPFLYIPFCAGLR